MKLLGKGGSGDSAINTNAWMMSYADMATTLLAMFIVLSTLGKDQTGVSLHNGTGSFIHAVDSFGLSGVLPSSSRVIQMQSPGPHYHHPPAGQQGDSKNAGTDNGESSQRVIDLEEEQLQQFLREMERQFSIEKLPRMTGQVVVDMYDRINQTAPYLTAKQAETVWQVVPLLRRPNYRIYFVVWATTPSESAWNRAVNQARLVTEEIATTAQLDPESRNRLIPLGQPWRHRDIRRPVLSLIVARTDQAG